MVWLALIIGTVNLAMGYLAAAALAEIPPWQGRRWPRFALRRNIPRRQARPAAEDAAPAQLAPAAVNELPTKWLDELAADGIIPQSFVEGIIHHLRLAATGHCTQLLAAEGRAWAVKAQSGNGDFAALVDDLRYVVRDWLDEEKGVAAMLAERRSRLAGTAAVGERLEQFLLDQAAEIRSVETAIASLASASDAETEIRRLHVELARLVDLVHARRDVLLQLLVDLGRGSRRAPWPSPLAYDTATALPGRLALDGLLSEWRRTDPHGERPLSLVLIDVDRFGRINARYGTRAGDRCLVALAALIGEFLPSDHPHDRLVRSGGESFCLVLGDALPAEALALAERIRQTIEAATFDDQSTEFELTVSCGIVEAGRDEPGKLWNRLQETLKAAKRAGRNRCLLEGAANSEPPMLSVKGRKVTLGAPAGASTTAGTVTDFEPSTSGQTVAGLAKPESLATATGT